MTTEIDFFCCPHEGVDSVAHTVLGYINVPSVHQLLYFGHLQSETSLPEWKSAIQLYKILDYAVYFTALQIFEKWIVQ